MTLDLDFLTHPQLHLEISPAVQDAAWQQSRRLSNPGTQWQGYLNQLCLNTLLPWAQATWETTANSMVPMNALPSFWELVNGSGLALNDQRIVLVPTEAIDADELRVPQEWIDIPAWHGDYYWGVQVEPDEAWLRVFGLATHQQLKQQGQYDWRDRTYTLPAPALMTDLSALKAALQLHTPISTRAACPALPALTTTQAQNLIQRLGHAELLQPRLEIPFEQWGALVAHGGWRKQLAESRWGLSAQRQVAEWLTTGIRQLAGQFGWQQMTWQPGLAGSRGEAAETPITAFARQLSINQVPHELRVIPLDAAANRWRFELQCLVPGRPIATGTRLWLLTEDLQPFEGNTEAANQPVDALAIDLALDPGEGIVWGIDPTPDDYDMEILKFG
jgi:hypothetical protein